MSLFARVSPALDLEDLLWHNPVRQQVTTTRSYAIWVDRKRALYSAWYEFFPRSEGAEIGPDATPVKHGTFATATERIPAVALWVPFNIPVREVRLSAGAEFIVAICGEIMTMPGLPKVPSADSIDVDAEGKIVGLF